MAIKTTTVENGRQPQNILSCPSDVSFISETIPLLVTLMTGKDIRL